MRIVIINKMNAKKVPSMSTATLTLSSPRPGSEPTRTGIHDLGATSPSQDRLDSQSLLQGQKSIAIVHNGAIYRLQATKLGKLILTK